MALFPRVTTWVSNQVLTASALNGEFNNILNNAQASSWIGFSANVAQMQQQTSPGGVGSESLAGSIADELQRLRFILAYTLGTTFWYDQTGRNLGTGNLAVDNADLLANAVTTAKIADGQVTPPKMGAANYVVSASCGVFVTSSTTPVDVTNLSVTITTYGRPIGFALISDTGALTAASMGMSPGTATAPLVAYYQLVDTAGSVVVATGTLRCDLTSIGIINVPPPGLFHILPKVAGTYTHKIRLAVSIPGSGTNTATMINLKLMAYEL